MWKMKSVNGVQGISQIFMKDRQQKVSSDMEIIECLAEDNRCPKCGSKRIIENIQYPMETEFDLRTGKEIFRDYTGKRIYKPSNRLLALRYLSSQVDAQCWLYECSKCGWISELFTQ